MQQCPGIKVPMCSSAGEKGGTMHKDWKQRRAAVEGRRIRNEIDEKHVDPKALELIAVGIMQKPGAVMR